MAVEHEELRLSVTLDDRASASLGRLQAALNNIGTEARKLSEVKIDLNVSGADLRGFAREAGVWSGLVGGMSSEMTKMGAAFLGRVTDLEGYSRGMVQLSLNSDRASTSAAQFTQNIRAFARGGIGAEEASKQLISFRDAIADTQRQVSTVRDRLFRNLEGADRAYAENFLRQLPGANPAEQLRLAKEYQRKIIDAYTARGQPLRGREEAEAFANLFRIPDLERIVAPRESTAEETAMEAARAKDAKQYDDAMKSAAEANERIGKALSGILLNLPGVLSGAEKLAGWWKGVADYLDRVDIRMRHAAEVANQTAPPPESWLEYLKFWSAKNVAREKAVAPELQGRAAHFIGGGNVPHGAGGILDMSSIPNISELLKPQSDATVAPFNPDDYAGTGWRGVPMSRNIIDLRTAQSTAAVTGTGDPVETNSEQMSALANELRRLNDFLAPSNIMNPAFHNAPMGGAEGESDPMRLPPGSKQPGGGATSEARKLPVLGPAGGGKTGRPIPKLPPEATPLSAIPGTPRPAQTEGTGFASWYGNRPDIGFRDPEDKGRKGVSERDQGIALGDPKTLGQWFYLTDPHTGEKHLTQQTDTGPNIRTQKLLDIHASQLARMGYTAKTFPSGKGLWDVARAPAGVEKPGFRGGGAAAAEAGELGGRVSADGAQRFGGAQRYGAEYSADDLPMTSAQRETTERSFMDQRDYLPGRDSANIDDRRRIDLTGDPGGLGGTVEDEWGEDFGLPKRTRWPQAPLARQLGLHDITLPASRGPGGFVEREDTGFDDSDTGGTNLARGRGRDLDAGALDRTPSNDVDVDTSGLFSVNVNAPKGTTVKASGEGLLGKSEVSRSMPMEAE